MTEQIVLTFDPERLDAKGLEPYGTGPLTAWTSFPVIALECKPEAIAAVKALPGVLHVHQPRIRQYTRILDSIDKLCGLPEEKRSELSAINLSISPGPGAFDPAEPMNVATYVAANLGLVTVVAAGNEGPAENTLNPWSVAPWVIGVTAADHQGTRIWEQASAGKPGDELYHPWVAAPGIDIPVLSATPGEFKRNHGTGVASVLLGFPEGHAEATESGTSLAAPVITRLVSYLTRFIRVLVDTHQKLEQVWASGAIDLSFAITMSKMEPFPSLLSELRDKKVAVQYRLGVGVMRQMLAAAARPVPGYGVHQAGAGFVDDAVVESYLKKFSSADFLQLFADPAAAAVELQHAGPILPASAVDELLAELKGELRALDMPVI